MTTMEDTVTANGHQLGPWHPGQLQADGRPVSALPQQQDSPGQPRTAEDKPGRRRWWRRRRREGTAFIGVALFAVVQVAVVAFSGSWQHQYELSIHLGQAHWVAGMQPLSVEGLIVSATLVIWYAGRHGYRRREVWGAYLVLAAGVGQTVLMNLGADYRWPWLGPEISIWPAVAFVAAYEMAVWLVRKRQDSGRDSAPSIVAADDASESVPAEKNPVDKTAGEPVDKRVDKPAPRRTTLDSRTAMDKAAAAIRRHPDWTDTALAKSAGVSTKTVQRARNGKTGSTT